MAVIDTDPDHEVLRDFMETFNLLTGPTGLMIDQEVAERTALSKGVSPERIMRWRIEEGLVGPWSYCAGSGSERIANYHLWRER